MDSEREGWPERLRRARERRFATTWQAAKALGRLDPELPDTKTLHRYWSQRWESGAHWPSRTYRELIEKLLDTRDVFTGPAALPPGGGTAGTRDRRDRRGTSAWGTPAHSVVATGSTRGGVGREVRMATDDAEDHAALAESGLGERTLGQLHDDVVRMSRGYTLRPLGELFRDARRTRDRAAALADRTRRPDQLADLYAVAGQACGLLSTAAFDMGYWDSAARLANASLTYADLAGHPSLRAWSLGMRATVAHWQGRPAEALDQIEAALSVAPAGTPCIRLRLTEARAFAMLGNADGVAESLRRAEESQLVESHDDLHDGVAGEFGFTPALLEFDAGTAYVVLGDGPAAERHAWRALDLYTAIRAEDRPYYEENSARVDLACAKLLQGDLAGAREALGPVFALPPGQRVASLLSRLDRVRGLLAGETFRPSRDAARLAGETFRPSRDAARLAGEIADFTAEVPTHPAPEE